MMGGFEVNTLVLMNMLTNTIDIMLILYFIRVSMNKSVEDKRHGTLLIAGLVILNTLINLSLGLGNPLGFLAILMISSIIFTFILKVKYLKIFYIGLMASILMFIIEIIVVNFIILIFGILPSIIYEINIYRISAIIISKTVFYLIIRFGIRNMKIPNSVGLYELIPILIVTLFNAIIVYMTFILYKYLDIETNNVNMYLIGMGIGSLVFSWSIYLITKKIMVQSQQKVIWKMKEEEFKRERFFKTNILETFQTIKAQRHDMNNYISTLYGLIHLDKIDEAKQYINRINHDISYVNYILETNHLVIAALINTKIHLAEMNNIKFDLDIKLPNELLIDDVVLSIVLGNLIDNAIEASCLSGKTEKKVILEMYIKDEYLIISIRNTKNSSIKVDTKEILKGFTSKEDKDSHGLGLVNVSNIVNQYNGFMSLEDLGDIFEVNIAMLLYKDIV